MKMHKRKAVQATTAAHKKNAVMAGPGSAITLEIEDLSFTQVPSGGFYNEYNDYHDFLEPENGNCKGTINIKSIGTYYYGGDPGTGDIPVDIQIYEVCPDTREDGEALLTESLKDVIDEISDVDTEVSIGGGYTRTTFDGEFDVSAYSYAYGADIIMKVRIPDKSVVEFLDKVAHGEDRVVFYTVFVDDNVYDSYEEREAAIEVAEGLAENPEYAGSSIDVFEEEDIELFDGSYDVGDSELIWSN